MDSNTTTDIDGPLYLASTYLKQAILDYPLTACLQQVGVGLYQKNNQFLIHFWMKMKSFRDYLGLSNSCSYDIDDVIGRADRFGFQNYCSPEADYSAMYLDFLSIIVSQNRLNPIMQRANNDRSVRRALPVYTCIHDFNFHPIVFIFGGNVTQNENWKSEFTQLIKFWGVKYPIA